ncbi:hypothetical protein O6H91_22G023700 [Diphasiastrum complanatum]|uniref:Uncharacterized protein n=3 Tax=Diphasiastrum complanatum TaxID=34168 RepID=A0ACC2AFQ0_DIPCM|nr:hypothetical protein O6H91_22G023700 [Diphasiastrum complanatum]KAJ7515694.1 hypothetical protein O6H91_22G023700 [Diphasiastrum complanatum]
MIVSPSAYAPRRELCVCVAAKRIVTHEGSPIASSSCTLPSKARMNDCLTGLYDQRIQCFQFTARMSNAAGVMGVLSTPRNRDGDTDNKRMFLFGLGYTATNFADCLKKDGWHISGTCRSNERTKLMEEHGFDVYHFDPEHGGEDLKRDGLMALWNATHVLSTIPPTTNKFCDYVLGSHAGDVEYAARHRKLSWIGYLSSTGVYGDWQGEWVDEESEPVPFDKSAATRLDAERSWLLLGEKSKVPVHVFRLGGIYGPGRSALETIRSKKPLTLQQKMRGSRCFTSRVHVADICQVIFASMNSPYAGRIYNVVDDDPAPRAEVLAFASNLIEKHLPAHSEIGCSLVSHALQSQKADNGSKICSASNSGDALLKFTNRCETRGVKVPEKRVSNKRIKVELQVRLQYPTYRSGLEAILIGESTCP